METPLKYADMDNEFNVFGCIWLPHTPSLLDILYSALSR